MAKHTISFLSLLSLFRHFIFWYFDIVVLNFQFIFICLVFLPHSHFDVKESCPGSKVRAAEWCASNVWCSSTAVFCLDHLCCHVGPQTECWWVSVVFSGGFIRGRTPTPAPRTGFFLVDTGTGITTSCQTFIKGCFMHQRLSSVWKRIVLLLLLNRCSNYKQSINSVLKVCGLNQL